ncbi:MAG: hypothetical protein WD359_07975, partial [Dehalococcoidia bacterium]
MAFDFIRRVPAARAMARGVRRGLRQLRPLPLPRYLADTPDTRGGTPLESYFPPTISTLAEAARSPETAARVIAQLKKLTPTDDTRGQELFYLWAQGRFGAHWRYADITTTLSAAATLLHPRAYLEIGVRRGRSAAMVAAAAPDCAIYGFDLWLAEYGGLLAQAILIVAGLLLLGGAALGFEPSALIEGTTEALNAWIATQPTGGLVRPEDVPSFARLAVSILPYSAATITLLMLVFGLWLGARITSSSG